MNVPAGSAPNDAAHEPVPADAGVDGGAVDGPPVLREHAAVVVDRVAAVGRNAERDADRIEVAVRQHAVIGHRLDIARTARRRHLAWLIDGAHPQRVRAGHIRERELLGKQLRKMIGRVVPRRRIDVGSTDRAASRAI